MQAKCGRWFWMTVMVLALTSVASAASAGEYTLTLNAFLDKD